MRRRSKAWGSRARRTCPVLGIVVSSLLAAVVVPIVRAAGPDDARPSISAATSANAASPAESRLKADVSFLSADARAGRAPGTKGIEISAEYIAGVFKELGLKPAPGADGCFQDFTLTGRPKLGDPLELAVRGPDGKTLKATPKDEFSPLAIGTSGSLEDAPLVF